MFELGLFERDLVAILIIKSQQPISNPLTDLSIISSGAMPQFIYI
jgi:hypothetical protein